MFSTENFNLGKCRRVSVMENRLVKSVLVQEQVVHSHVKQTIRLKCLDLCRPKNSSHTPGRDPRELAGGEKENSDERKGLGLRLLIRCLRGI